MSIDEVFDDEFMNDMLLNHDFRCYLDGDSYVEMEPIKGKIL